MAFGKAFDLDAHHFVPAQSVWGASFPNPADVNFNYRKLFDSIAEGAAGISSNTRADFRVAIVGAGIAGLTAARELLRCGFTQVHIFEATDRYAGRHYTVASKDYGQYTTMEGGAMRFPPFLAPGSSAIEDGCSMLAYYYKEYGLRGEPFPNPGSSAADTGIFYNNGWLTDEPQQTMAIWKKTDKLPPTEAIQNVYQKWHAFAKSIIDVVSVQYVSGNWPIFWKAIVNSYWRKTFRDVVLDPVKTYDPARPGDFGGAGMNEDEARLFYLIGGGDGSWGAFYNLSFLYAYRTFVHGFGSDLFLLQGRFTADGVFTAGPHYQDPSLVDYNGRPISAPRYVGSASLDDCMLFETIAQVPIQGSGKIMNNVSVYDLSRTQGETGLDVRLYFSTKVDAFGTDNQPGLTTVNLGWTDKSGTKGTGVYDAVVFTVPTWQFDGEIQVGFLDNDKEPDLKWPFALQTYLARADWEPCCKVFVGLHEAYWNDPTCRIPQLLTSDTFVHDTYGVLANVHGKDEQKPVLLVSYTWWRDALKMACYSDEELVKKCIAEIDQVLLTAKNIGQPLSPYVDFSNSWVIHWEEQPTYKGAARLYDQREWTDTQLPMGYNQKYSAQSGIYFAGEAYGVDAGWTEPAFRSAVDAVLHISKNNGASFNVPGFDFDRDYPTYDLKWRPV